MEMDTMNLFAIATREKYRFQYHGILSVEDLWDLDAKSLDSVFKVLNSQLKRESEESLLTSPSKEDNDLTNKIDIIKYIVGIKLAEAEAKKNEAAKRAEKQKLMRIISRKEDEALEGKSVDELKQMLDSL